MKIVSYGWSIKSLHTIKIQKLKLNIKKRGTKKILKKEVQEISGKQEKLRESYVFPVRSKTRTLLFLHNMSSEPLSA